MNKIFPNSALSSHANRTRNLSILIGCALVLHTVLLPYTLSGTYDAYIHMFFGDHYNRSWFDPWEPRWYTGFSVTSYPPATHMMIGALQHIVSLKFAYILTMMTGLIILILGFYRFTNIWASQGAFLSTLLLILASSVAETIHIFGQLPTIFSLGIFLNAMPHVHRWLVFGRYRSLIAAVILAGAATSAHHVTTIFGSVFFIGPLAAYAWFGYLGHEKPFATGLKIRNVLTAFLPVFRGIALAIFILAAVIITVFPYWYWSLTDPITQVPIPHGTRENFITRPDLGMVFFLMPWGMSLLFLPFIFYRGFTSNLWPFAASLLLCFFLGLGGTTPIAPMVLRGAFDILTLDRFTFWGTILALPFVGLILTDLISGKLGIAVKKLIGTRGANLLVTASLAGYALIAILIGTMSVYRNLQPRTIDPAPIVQFMESDEHDRWRYLTLGFGDQFAYVSAQTTALSVDGNYHSARRLPDLTRYSVERLENAKYLGVAGLGSLQQFLSNANEYSLKYIFSNDAFYDPLLYASGWNALVRLPNNIVIWEKPNIDPLPFTLPRKNFPFSHRLMWGLLPPAMGLAGLLIIGLSGARLLAQGVVGQNLAPPKTERKSTRDARVLLASVIVMSLVFLGLLLRVPLQKTNYLASPDLVISRYTKLLNMREFRSAYELLDPESRDDFESYFFERMWDGGLLNSYGELKSVQTKPISRRSQLMDFQVYTAWLTAIGLVENHETMRTINRGGRWYILPQNLEPQQTPERIMARDALDFHVTGRRQPLPETDFHKDRPDRPEFALKDARLVKYKGQYSLIGVVMNTDADPLSLSMNTALLDANQEPLIEASAGLVTPFRLLPMEASGFRVDFQGMLSLNDAEKYTEFDPDIFIPPLYETPPEFGYIGAASTLGDSGYVRSVAVFDLQSEDTEQGLRIFGRVMNNGIYTISTTKILATAYDQAGALTWSEAGFVKSLLRPGQSADFELYLPKASEVEIIRTIDENFLDLNMNFQNAPNAIPDADTGTIKVDEKSGYRSVRLYLDPQIYEDLF